MADVQGRDGSTNEPHEERERSQKMKQENQVLLKKLHEVVGRYRLLQQQYQSMVNERQDHQQSGMLGAANDASVDAKNGQVSPTNHADGGSVAVVEDPTVKKLEAEKHELIEKLKNVLGTCRVVQKQLQEAKEENEALKTPGKPHMFGGSAPSTAKDAGSADAHRDAMETLQVRVLALEASVTQKEEEKQEIVGKLQEVISRYQSLQKQLEDKICEHDAAMSKVAALESELRTSSAPSAGGWMRRGSGNLGSNSTTDQPKEGWLRRGSGNSNSNSSSNGATDQAKDKEIAKMKDDLQKLTVAMVQEQARTAVFREENARLKEQIVAIEQEKQTQDQDSHAHTKQTADLQREIKLMRKQQEDSEQLYLEVASKLNHTLRENGELQARLGGLQRSLDEADQLREHAISGHADDVSRLQEQHAHAVAAKDAKHEEERRVTAKRIHELTEAASSTSAASAALQKELQTARQRAQELAQLADRLPEKQRELEELRVRKDEELAGVEKEKIHMVLQIASLNDQFEKACGEAADLQTELARSGENEAAVRRELSFKQDELQATSDLLASVRLQLDTSDKAIAAAIHERDQLKQIVDDLRKDQASESETIAQLQAEMSELIASHKQELMTTQESYEQTKSALQQEVEAKENVITDLRSEVESITARYDDISQAQATMASTIENVQAEKEAIATENAQLVLNVSQLSEKLSSMEHSLQLDQQSRQAEYTKKIADLEANVSKQEADATVLRGEIQQLNLELTTTKEEHAVAISGVEQTERERSASHLKLVADFEARLEDTDKLQIENASLQTQVMTLEAQLLQSEAESDESVRELGDLREKLAEVERARESARKEAQEYLDEVHALEGRMSQLISEHKELESRKQAEMDHIRDELEHACESLRVEMEAKERELVNAQERLAAATVHIGDADSGRVQYEDKIQSLHDQLQTVSDENERLTKEVSDLQTTVTDQNETAVKANEAATALREEIDSLKATVVELNQQIITHEERISQVNRDAAALHDQAVQEASDVKAKLQSAESEIAEVKAENTRMLFEVAKTTDSAVVLKKQYEELQLQLQAKNEAIERSEQSICELEALNATLDENVQTKTIVVDQLRDEIASLRASGEQERLEMANRLQESATVTSTELHELKMKYEGLQIQLKAQNDDVEQREEQIRELEALRERLAEEVRVGSVAMEQLRVELVKHQATAESEKEALAARLEETTRALEGLQHQQSLLKEELEVARSTSSETSELKQLQDELHAQLKERNHAIEQNEVNVRELEAANTSLVEEVRAGTDALERVRDELAVLQDSAENEKKELSIQLSETTQRLESVEQAILVANEQNTSLQQELETVKSTSTEISQLHDQLSRLQEHLGSINNENQGLIDQLAESNIVKQSLADEFQVEQASSIQKINVLEATLDAKTAELNSVGEELILDRQEKSALQAMVDRLENQIEHSQSSSSEHATQLAAAHDQLVVRMETLTAEIASLHVERDELISSKSTVEETLRVKMSTLEDVQAQYAMEAARASDLEIQVAKLADQLEANDEKLLALSVAEEEVASLQSQLANSAGVVEEAFTLRKQLEDREAVVAQKDEIIGKLKTKTEEVVNMYKKLKEHAQEVQERLTEKTSEWNTLREEVDAVKLSSSHTMDELVSERENRKTLAEELAISKVSLQSMQETLEGNSASLSDELAASKAELQAIRKQHEKAMEQAAQSFKARNEEWQGQLNEVEHKKNTLVKTVEAKDSENQEVVDKMKELLTRYRGLQEEHQQAEEQLAQLKDELKQSAAQISSIKAEQDGTGAAHESIVNKLQEEIVSLRAQLDVEIEGSNAARTALEVYKKRAGTALKKATQDSRSSIKKVEEETSQLQQEIMNANSRASALELELVEANKRLEEAEAVADAQVKAVKEKAQQEKDRDDAESKQQLDAIQAELSSVQADLQATSQLSARLQELEDTNRSLLHDIANLQREVQQKSEVAREMMKVKDGELAQLRKQLDEATRAATAAAEQLKVAAATYKTVSSTVSHTDEKQHVASRRLSSLSSEEQHGHLAAAMADVQSSIPLATTTAGGSVDGQILKLARAQAMRDEEATKTKRQVHTLEDQVHLFQKKYEDTLALLEESSRQKRRIQELSARTTDGLNIEYLKNVVIKYIESQNQSEKDRLIPVIATVLHFSPQEMKKINDAHHRVQDEGGGLLGGVFSLFSAAPAAPAPKPLAVPTNLHARTSATATTTGGGGTSGFIIGGQQEDDDNATPLNPFASSNY